MKLEDARQHYYDHSGKASEVTRQLAFAGIALIWIFKAGEEGPPHLPPELFFPAALIVLGLVFDFFHYISLATLWGTFSRLKEKAQVTEFRAPAWLNWPGLICFVLKIVSIALAYGFLLSYAGRRLV